VVKTGAPAEGEITVCRRSWVRIRAELAPSTNLTTAITITGRQTSRNTVGRLGRERESIHTQQQLRREPSCRGELTITLTFHPTNSAAGVGPKTASFNVTEKIRIIP